MISYRSKEKETLDIQPDLSTVFDKSNETFHLFDLRDVKMLLSPTKVCDSKFVVIAPSAPKNQKLRNELRKQFENEAFIFFILARPSFKEGDSLLKKENAIHGDILQGDFKDSYSTVAYKTVMAFIWINK